MTLTLDHYLDSLFHHGLDIMRENEKAIQHNWEQVQHYFKHTGKKIASTIVISVKIFSEIIFNHPYDKETIMNQLRDAWNKEIGNNLWNQFTLSLLENSVYQAAKVNKDNNYNDHQAIQYVFTKINEHILTGKLEHLYTMDTFLKHLVVSEQLPIEWIAVVARKGNRFYVDKWFNQYQCLLNKYDNLAADTIFDVMEQLLGCITHSVDKSVMTIPFENMTLLLCTDKHCTGHIVPFIHHALYLFQSSKTILNITQQEQRWKDSVIMFYESIMQAKTLKEALELVTKGFTDYLPFERCGIFSYSPNDEIGIGLSGHRFNIKAIQEIAEDVRNFPLIHNGLELLQLLGNGIKFLQPLYISDAKNSFPIRYIQQFQLKSVVVAPIFKASHHELIGAAILDQGANKHFAMSQDTYKALIKFGQSAGEIIGKFKNNFNYLNQSLQLSSREIEVLTLMAEGESTSSAADKLHLSEYTVRDYITKIMQKMKAKNRTEAVAYAIRQGII
ncbi:MULTISPECIES: response regulator transcription factor [Clostridia]|uniref:response regulator transcription factor n=1 Tax=Clostridia TaxID=186801 RepID=UPI000EA17061|nr:MULTISPECIES: response regulator transcription factor [Clostridia]NBJ69587.1 DNA-binding response regulator [Roseburia sp. 1XD42-34]RKI78352.1 DNA-binding response regulator [Clostridium sp. 1xD42-85]